MPFIKFCPQCQAQLRKRGQDRYSKLFEPWGLEDMTYLDERVQAGDTPLSLSQALERPITSIAKQAQAMGLAWPPKAPETEEDPKTEGKASLDDVMDLLVERGWTELQAERLVNHVGPEGEAQ